MYRQVVPGLIEHARSALSLSYLKIREKYADRPICLIEYIDKEINEKSIVIHFDEDDTSLRCFFDADRICTTVYLYPDADFTVETVVQFLVEYYEYNFVKSRFIVSDCYLRVEDMERSDSGVCLILHQ